MASYNASAGNLTMEERRAIGAPINAVPVTQAVGNWALKTINIDVNNFNGQVYTPFTIRWAIFPAEMRADAEAAAATGAFGMLFIEDNVSPAWAVYQVDYEEEKVVPGPVYLARPSRSQAAPQQQWFGTAPACSTDKTDCTSRGMTVVRYDKSGGGKSCSGGKKVLCEFPTPGCMWIGAAPECNGVIPDCAANNMALAQRRGRKKLLNRNQGVPSGTRASLPTSANATYKGMEHGPRISRAMSPRHPPTCVLAGVVQAQSTRHRHMCQRQGDAVQCGRVEHLLPAVLLEPFFLSRGFLSRHEE